MRLRVKTIEPKDVIESGAVESAAQPDSLAGDLGPQADQVRTVIDRAARLSPSDRRRVSDEERWRAWPISIMPAGGLASVRASAYAFARKAGRPQLPAAVASAVLRALGDDDRDRDLRQAVADAALAVALADVLPDDVRDRLGAAWRAALA